MDARVADGSAREQQDEQDRSEQLHDEHGPADADQAVVVDPRPDSAEAQVSVEHRPRLAALVGLAAAAVTVAWFSRALQTGGLVDWLVCLGLGLVGLVQLAVLRDSRAPLLVADDQGVRIRHGVTWSGLRWRDIDQVELEGLRSSDDASRELPFGWLFGDRRIVVHPRVAADHTDDAEVSEAAEAAQTFAIPLSATTRVVTTGLTGDLAADLVLLSSGRAPVVVPDRRAPASVQVTEAGDEAAPEGPALEQDPAPEDTKAMAPEVDHEDAPADDEGSAEQVEAVGAVEELPATEAETFEPVPPARPVSPAVRAEVVRESVRMVASGSTIPVQRSEEADAPVPVEELAPIGDALVGGARGDESFGARPAADPVIGPMIAAARKRARLSIDELSDRTRIRPHVLESIEVDDFEPCGGDFYARGHLRTLARIFGLDAQELLDLYDERYAQGEIEARQVFEAELATGIGGGVRAAASGPRWSLLVAAVIAIGLVWAGARIFTDTPKELVSPAPGVVDSAGLASGKQADTPKTTLAPLGFTAVGASPQVVVRDRSGRILWAGQLAEGQHQQIIGQAPFDVTTSNGAAVKVSYLGKPRGTVGSTSAAESRKFG